MEPQTKDASPGVENSTELEEMREEVTLLNKLLLALERELLEDSDELDWRSELLMTAQSLREAALTSRNNVSARIHDTKKEGRRAG